MQSMSATKLGVLKSLVFFLYLAAVILVVIFVWAVSTSRQPSADFVFLFYAALFGFLGLIADIICDMGVSQIKNEQRQELILEELRRTRI
jgi:uncharacterized ion transporter superfamily protein YfcC